MNTIAAIQPVQIHARQRQLFLDDFGVSETHNLKRTMHHPEKKGAVIEPDFSLLPEGSKSTYQIRSAPSWDSQEEVFRLIVVETTGPIPAHTSGSGNMCFESKDGLNWYPKKLEQGETIFFKASLPNGKTVKLYSLLDDSTDPDPSRRFKSLSHQHLDSGSALFPVVSPDLLTWNQFDMTPIASFDEWNLSLDEIEHLFIATPKVNGVYGRSVGLSTSNDFEHWTKSKLVFQTDDLDQELAHKHIDWYMKSPTLYEEAGKHTTWRWHNVDIYNMGVFRYESLYIGIPAFFHRFGPGNKQKSNIGEGPRLDKDGPQYAFTLFPLLCSQDLQNWKRVCNRQPFMLPSTLDSGAYDLAKSQPPSSPVIREDELWFYYNGLKYSGWSPKPDHQDPESGAVCLAVLRRDGFVSLDAGKERGSLITHPLKITGTRLFINVNASKGELLTTFLNPAGESIDGFKINQCNPVKGDHTRIEVTWEDKSNVLELSNQHIRVRFSLIEASLFSYWFE